MSLPPPVASGLGAAVAREIDAGRLALDPERVERDLARLVLALLETLRQVMEREAVRLVEAGRLSEAEEERVGLTLMRAEARLAEIAAAFGLSPSELVLEIGLGATGAEDRPSDFGDPSP